MESNTKRENIFVMLLFIAMFIMYFMRYYSHEMVVGTDGYRPVALAMTGAFIAVIFLFFAVLLKKSTPENRLLNLIWMGLFAGVNFGTFVPRHMLGSVYLYLAILFFAIGVILTAQRFLWLIPLLYALGIYLYPGFYLLAMPMLLLIPHTTVAEEKVSAQKRLSVVALIALLAGVFVCMMRILGYLPVTDPYGVMLHEADYGYFEGLFSGRLMRLTEGVSFLLFLTPVLILLWRKEKSLKPLMYFFPILIEAVLQQHLGVCAYYFVSGLLWVFLYRVKHEEYYTELLTYRWRDRRDIPGVYIFYLYLFALTPFYVNHICRATEWIGKTVLFFTL